MCKRKRPNIVRQMSHMVTLGPASLRLTGSGQGFDEVANELEAVREVAPSTPDAEIDIHPKLIGPGFTPQVYSAKGRFYYDADHFYRGDPVPQRIGTWTASHACQAEFAVKPPKPFRPTELQRVSPIMTYAAFWGLAHFILSRRGAGFVHAGIASDGREATCFVGTGGCGKTSSLFTLLEDPRYRYLSEDFGIVDRSGATYYCPKHVSIYSTDTRSKLLDQAVQSSLTMRQRGVWEYRKRKGNPRVKLSPRVVVDGRVAAQQEIARVFYLVRAANTNVEIRPLPVEELATRATSVALRELAVWAESLLLLGANDVIDSAFPRLSEVEEQLRDLYRAAFGRAERSLVLVPQHCSGAELLRALRNSARLP